MTTVSSPFTRAGREVVIAEAARTPMGRSHPERGWFRDTHPNTMLAAWRPATSRTW
jgi:acetyl-CoA acyltransferase